MSQKVSDERGRLRCQMCDLQLPAMALARTPLSYHTVVSSSFSTSCLYGSISLCLSLPLL